VATQQIAARRSHSQRRAASHLKHVPNLYFGLRLGSFFFFSLKNKHLLFEVSAEYHGFSAKSVFWQKKTTNGHLWYAILNILRQVQNF
jgi:hypothetical protein